MRVTKPCVLLLIALFAGATMGAVCPGYQEERVIYGKVTDTNGTPLPNVQVILAYAPFGVIREPRWTELSKTTTSESGEYRFSVRSGSVDTELREGAYRITFKYPGLGQVSRTTHIGLNVSAHDGVPKLVQEVNVQLRPRANLELTVPYSSGGIRSSRAQRTARSSATVPPDPPASPLDPPENTGGPPDETPTPETRPSPRPAATSTPSSTANANSSANTNVSANTNASANANTGSGPAPDPSASEIDQLLKSLDLGNIAFNTPESMSLNEAKKVELLLSSSLSQEELKKTVEKHNVEGPIQVERIEISDQMEATLTGDGFQITEVLPARRAISKKGSTEWKWDVRALKEGKLRLHLTLNALVTVKGNPPQLHTIRTFDKEYVVVVGVKDTVISFASKNWQWLWTTVFLPVGAWLWKRKRKNGEAAA